MLKQIQRRNRGLKKTLPEALQAAQQNYGEVAVWTTDEHRLGLKPILKRLWAPRGQRPTITIYPRYEWLYLYAFVQPATGASQWFVMPRLNRDVFAIALAQFAATTDKHILLVMDNAAWHRSSKLTIPDNVTLLFQPPYAPEVQPAEHLWQLTDAPLTNFCPDNLDCLETLLTDQCAWLQQHPELIKSTTKFHWWPDI